MYGHLKKLQHDDLQSTLMEYQEWFGLVDRENELVVPIMFP